MSPADVLLALVSAEAVLWADGDRLRFRAPEGALDEALRGHATRVRGALIALVRAGAVLPVARNGWDAEAIYEVEERAGILQFEGGMARSDAEREAERLVRLAHARAFVERAALVVDPPGGAVASSPARGKARTDVPYGRWAPPPGMGSAGG